MSNVLENNCCYTNKTTNIIKSVYLTEININKKYILFIKIDNLTHVCLHKGKENESTIDKH